MIKMVLASHNKNKIKELETLIRQYSSIEVKLLSLDDIGYLGDIEETGTTFEENAVIKASVPAEMGYIGIADDSGLCVDALDGAPGVYSARYSGVGANDEKNNQKLLEDLKDFSANERTARFVCVMACVFPKDYDKNQITVRGECEGIMLTEKRGDNGFGYDPLFLYEPAGKTFAEISMDEKNKISHRGNAVRLLAEKINLGEIY